MPILQGPLRGKKWIVGSQRHAFWLGAYEPHMQRLIEREVRAGTIVYDVGANVGFYTLLAAHLTVTGKVFAFEPLPANVAYLNKHLDLNLIKNVTVFDVAISDHVGWSSFAQEGTGAMGRLQDRGSLRVATTTLDALLQEEKIAPPNYIKMDIEGEEIKALAGAQVCFRENRPILFLAIHGNSVQRACCEVLRSWHYDISVIEQSSPERAELLCRPLTASGVSIS